MNEFNFGSLATTPAVSTSQPQLKPWGIYPVTFSGARKVSIQGRKDPSVTYEILKIRFENNDGYYEESIFYPKPEDATRPKYTSKDGHEYEGASSFERTMSLIAQVGEVLNPDGFKKMQILSSKFKTFEDVVKSFISIMDKVKGKETNLKLIGRNQNGTIVPALPKFVAVNKNGEVFVCDNFIGDKLFFSAYEQAKKNEYENTKPTEMPDAIEVKTEVQEETDEIDFESLL